MGFLLLLVFAVGVTYGSMNVSQVATQYRTVAARSNFNKWDFLNATLGGRLEKGTPVSSPCFPIVNGNKVTVNNTTCAAVQKGYTDPLFRAPIFGAYMMVSR